MEKKGKKAVKPEEIEMIGKRWIDTEDDGDDKTYRVVDVYWDEGYRVPMVQFYDFDEYKYNPPAKPDQKHLDWDSLHCIAIDVVQPLAGLREARPIAHRIQDHEGLHASEVA